MCWHERLCLGRPGLVQEAQQGVSASCWQEALPSAQGGEPESEGASTCSQSPRDSGALDQVHVDRMTFIVKALGMGWWEGQPSP